MISRGNRKAWVAITAMAMLSVGVPVLVWLKASDATIGLYAVSLTGVAGLMFKANVDAHKATGQPENQ